MNKYKKVFTSCVYLLLFVLMGCSKGYVIVEKSDQFNKQQKQFLHGKVMYFPVEVISYTIKEDVKREFIKAEAEQRILTNKIRAAAKKNKVNIEFMDLDNPAIASQYMNVLIPLSNDIHHSTSYQNNPLNKSRFKSSQKPFQQKIFVSSPVIPPDYSFLSKELGSPYFAVCGFIEVNAKPKTRYANQFISKNKSYLRRGVYYYFYNIIVNVETSEIIYREVKRVSGKVSPKIIDPVVYDSFFILKNNLHQ